MISVFSGMSKDNDLARLVNNRCDAKRFADNDLYPGKTTYRHDMRAHFFADYRRH